jgi:hypothetical protein
MGWVTVLGWVTGWVTHRDWVMGLGWVTVLGLGWGWGCSLSRWSCWELQQAVDE